MNDTNYKINADDASKESSSSSSSGLLGSLVVTKTTITNEDYEEGLVSCDELWFDFENIKIPESVKKITDESQDSIEKSDLLFDSKEFSNVIEVEDCVEIIAFSSINYSESSESNISLLTERDNSQLEMFSFIPQCLKDSKDSKKPLEISNELSDHISSADLPYQLIVLGRNNDFLKQNEKTKQDINFHIDKKLLSRLFRIASGSRSMLVELALVHMIKSLEDARQNRQPVVILDASAVTSALDF